MGDIVRVNRRAILLPALWAVFSIFLFSTVVSAQQKPRGWVPPSPGAPKVGEKVKDFTLPDTDGKPRTISKLLAEADNGKPGWMLLVFYRGYW